MAFGLHLALTSSYLSILFSPRLQPSLSRSFTCSPISPSLASFLGLSLASLTGFETVKAASSL